MIAAIKDRKEPVRVQNPCPDPVGDVGKVIGTITGAIGLVALIKKGWNNWRDKHPTFRYTVLKSLKQIEEGQRRFDDFNAATLRERLGSVYLVYVKEHGWCPRSQKEKIAVLYDLYMANYGNSTDNELMKSDKAEIMELPESEDFRLI